MAVIVSLGKEELDKMCQEMIDCLDNNTYPEERFVQTLSNWDLKIIKAANVPENYMEEGHMREHWQHLSKYLTTLQHTVIKELKVETEDHQHEKRIITMSNNNYFNYCSRFQNYIQYHIGR